MSKYNKLGITLNKSGDYSDVRSPLHLPFLLVDRSLIILVRFWRVFWVDATTADTIELSLRDIAADPDAQACRVERSAKSVLQWLSRVERDWLIMFDNASGAYGEVA